MKNARLYYLDIAKGILILLLLVSHFGNAVRESKIDIQEAYFAGIYFLHPLFSTFFMQCFFIISGYCSNFSYNVRKFFYKQLKEIIIPSIFFGIFNGLILYLQGTNSLFCIETFWFLNALLFAKLFCWAVNKLKISIRLYCLISVALFLLGVVLNNYEIGENIFSIRQCLCSCLFVVLGMLLRQEHYMYNFLIKYSWLLYMLIFLIVYILNLEFRLPIIDGAFHKFSFYNTPSTVIICITGSFTILRISRSIGRFFFFEYFGKNSLVIYCFHFIPLVYVVQLLSRFLRPCSILTGTCFYLLALLLEISVMAIIVKIFNKTFFKYCIGKW